MSQPPNMYDDGIGGVGPTPRPRTATDESPVDGTELTQDVPGAGRCPVCAAVVPPPSIRCPDDGATLDPVDEVS